MPTINQKRGPIAEISSKSSQLRWLPAAGMTASDIA